MYVHMCITNLNDKYVPFIAYDRNSFVKCEISLRSGSMLCFFLFVCLCAWSTGKCTSAA